MGGWRFTKHLKERLGFLPAKTIQSFSGGPRIWVHGASLGEIRVALAIVKSLLKKIPACNIIVSTVTAHGRNLALETFDKEIPVVYAPLDLPGCAFKALSFVRPDVMVFLETEIWPAWIFTAHKLGIRLALLNGRISPRSFKSYMKFRPLLRSVLKNFDTFSMISERDADRITAMGAAPGKIRVNGNAKYDITLTSPNPSVPREMRHIFNLTSHKPVIVAGSTRGGEEAMLLDVYERIRSKHSDIVLILAPRHIKRAADICTLIRHRGHPCQLRTEIGQNGTLPKPKIIVIDTFGELFNIYSIATLVFCGASLVPLGGQNPLEPAVWGKPVLFGPHMEDFQDAKEMLESAGGGMQVADAGQLAKAFLNLLDHPEKAAVMGQKARERALQIRASAHRHAEIIEELLSGKSSSKKGAVID